MIIIHFLLEFPLSAHQMPHPKSAPLVPELQGTEDEWCELCFWSVTESLVISDFLCLVCILLMRAFCTETWQTFS